jgi:hypothetical protein
MKHGTMKSKSGFEIGTSLHQVGVAPRSLKTGRYFWRLACVRALVAGCAVLATSTLAQVVTYRGSLQSGGHSASGLFDIRTAVYDAAAGGNLVAGPVTNAAVGVTNGMFFVPLNFAPPVWNGARWLEIAVRTNLASSDFTVLQPLQSVLALPFSCVADLASDVIGGGAGLTNISGGNIRPGTIGSNQLDSATLRLISQTDTNTVQAIGDQRYTSANLGRGFLTPYDFGAVGDGQNDDTAPLQAWLDHTSASNMIAFLPPAKGLYYRITRPLWVSNTTGIKIVGSGGQVFGSTIPVTKCRIHQSTIGADGLCINYADNIWLEGFLITGDVDHSNFTNNSRGIAFIGDSPDSDCDVVTTVGARGFGNGLWAGSVANINVISSCFTECGIGVNLPYRTALGTISTLNNVAFQTCQISYNYTNDVYVGNGKILFDTCDLAALKPGCISVRIENEGDVILRNTRIEAWVTSAPRIVATAVNPGWVSLELEDTMVWKSDADPSDSSYSIVLSNAYCTIRNSPIYAYATDNLSILEYNGPHWDGSTGINSDIPQGVKFYLNGVPSVRRIGGGGLNTVYAALVPTVPGVMQYRNQSGTFDRNGTFLGNWDDTWSLEVSAQLTGPPFYDPSVRIYDLLAYAKDKQQLATFNNLAARHVFGTTNLPPVAIISEGAGSGATAGVDPRATDVAATVTIQAGTTPAPGSTIWSLTFGNAYSWSPHMVVTPANASAAQVRTYVTSNPGSCSLALAGSDVLSPGTTYAWHVVVLGQ